MTVNIFDFADTWNDGATTFNGIKLDVTDTASDAASKLIDLQVGGTSRFSVNKNGTLTLPENERIAFGTFFNIVSSGDRNCALGDSATQLWIGLNETIVAPLNGYFGIGGYGASVGAEPTARVRLYDDADHVLGQRNGVNPQASRLYNTYTNASNYERGGLRWSSNVLELFSEAAGTGTARNVALNGANRATKIADPSGGATVDAEARTAINAIIDAIESHGIAATV